MSTSRMQNETNFLLKHGRKCYVIAIIILVIFVGYFLLLDYSPIPTRKRYNLNYFFNESDMLDKSYPSGKSQTGILDEVASAATISDISSIVWHLVPAYANSSDKWTLLVSSSFYDHRIEKIVVLLASDAAYLLKQNDTRQRIFFCQLFHYKTDSMPMEEIEGYFYTSYIFYCPFSRKNFSNSLPFALSIRRNDQEVNCTTNWTIPIENLLERNNTITKPKTLALCVGIMFGFQNWLILLQYIEFHRIQGVEKFFFFYHELHWTTIEIFRFYIKYYDFVEIVYWNPNHYKCSGEYKCQLMRDNFCSYSLMYKYKYVGNSDFDEIFFPTKGRLVDLLQRIDTKDRGAFTFRAKYHQLLKNDLPQWNHSKVEDISLQVGDFLPLYHFVNVSTMAGHTYSPKTITKPETVQKRWIHFVRNHIDGYSTYTLEENDGVLRHFKIREWWGGWADHADKEVKYKIIDPYMEIGRDLINNVTERITAIVKNITSSLTNETLTEFI